MKQIVHDSQITRALDCSESLRVARARQVSKMDIITQSRKDLSTASAQRAKETWYKRWLHLTSVITWITKIFAMGIIRSCCSFCTCVDMCEYDRTCLRAWTELDRKHTYVEQRDKDMTNIKLQKIIYIKENSTRNLHIPGAAIPILEATT